MTAPVKEAELTTVTLTRGRREAAGIMTAAGRRRAVPRTRTLGGEIMAPSGAALAITAPVAGTLQAPPRCPPPAPSCRAGQMLFRLVPLQPSERDAAVDAQQAVETATARRDAAALKAQRAERLVKDGAGSRRALEEAQAELAVAEAELKAARDRVALARAAAATSPAASIIEAPETAIVQDVHVREGQTVAAGAPLIDLVRLDDRLGARAGLRGRSAGHRSQGAPRRCWRSASAPMREGQRAQPIPAPPSADATHRRRRSRTTRCPIRTSGSGRANASRCGCRAVRRRPASSSRRRRCSTMRIGGTWVYVVREPQVYTRGSASWSPTSAARSPCCPGAGAGRAGRHRRRGRAVRRRVRRRKVGHAMMRWLVERSLRLRLVVVALALVLIVAGSRAAQNTPLDVFPEFAPPLVEIQTEAPGLSTGEVESLVTVPLENALNGVPGLRRCARSRCSACRRSC